MCETFILLRASYAGVVGHHHQDFVEEIEWQLELCHEEERSQPSKEGRIWLQGRGSMTTVCLDRSLHYEVRGLLHSKLFGTPHFLELEHT